MGRLVREKHHRLTPECYIGQQIVAFTLCIKNRFPVFTDKNIVEIFRNILLDESCKHECDIHIYLFMPDHLHLLIEGKTDTANPLRMVNRFKQYTGYWFYKYQRQFHWQKDYYDHIVRNDEELERQVHYILNNPVRAAIVSDWKYFEYKGSTIYNFDEWS